MRGGDSWVYVLWVLAGIVVAIVLLAYCNLEVREVRQEATPTPTIQVVVRATDPPEATPTADSTPVPEVVLTPAPSFTPTATVTLIPAPTREPTRTVAVQNG